MVAKGGEALIKGKVRETLIRELIPLAFVVTPNIHEAEVLADMKITSVQEMKKAARIIYKFGAKNVVVKGGHLTGDAVDVLYDGKKFYTFSSRRIDKKETHGTGCTFSAAIVTLLARGESVIEAVKGAKTYITEAIMSARNIGAGYRLINHLAPLLLDK
jgi:hydroxymethylpyrimidine/phosphomethylpyrimidine kinase